MTLSRIVCAVGLVIAVVSAQNSTFDRTSESALLAANEELQKAIATRDEATIRKRLADDFTIVHNTGGAIQAREGFIRSVISGQASFAAEATYDRSTQLVGTDVALINETLNLQQGPRSRWRTDVSVWRRRAGIWQQVYHQGTPIGDGIVESAEDRANYGKLAGRYRTSDARAISIRAEERRLLMFGPRDMDVQQVLVPQGKLEYQVAGYRIKFSLDGNNVSATAIQNGKPIWTANRSGE